MQKGGGQQQYRFSRKGRNPQKKRGLFPRPDSAVLENRRNGREEARRKSNYGTGKLDTRMF